MGYIEEVDSYTSLTKQKATSHHNVWNRLLPMHGKSLFQTLLYRKVNTISSCSASFFLLFLSCSAMCHFCFLPVDPPWNRILTFWTLQLVEALWFPPAHSLWSSSFLFFLCFMAAGKLWNESLPTPTAMQRVTGVFCFYIGTFVHTLLLGDTCDDISYSVSLDHFRKSRIRHLNCKGRVRHNNYFLEI